MDINIFDKDPEESIINCIQRVAVYETRDKLFIIGSNNIESKFRVLQVDRSEAKDLVVVDDKHEYNRADVQKLIDRIVCENRSKTCVRKASAHAILGFVRLLEGHYLIMVTKRRKVAQIGHHMIYKVDETIMLYIPNGDKVSADEKRYLRTFQNVDLSSNFYFSYSYDVTRSLQSNLCPHVPLEVKVGQTPWETTFSQKNDTSQDQFLRRNQPNFKFVWNEYLLQDVDLHPEWKIHVIHGFISQSNISVYGLPIYLTLIARRSKKFAGTRFLKRGCNFEGDVANEVETEQIVHDSSVSSFSRGRFTSFVQIRGSVPGHWSQDTSKMVNPKPLITMDMHDAHFRTAGRHMNQLLERYGSPIVVLNLVKNKERRPHETVLRNEFISAIRYLNQFLPSAHAIQHIAYDMAYVNKTKESVVMPELSEIAFESLKKTGIYRSWSSHVNATEGGLTTRSGRQFQTGVVRVNCVDCLDRTNTAAFALGKAALGLQLHALGVLADPVTLDFDTEAIRMLEEVYEDHGDTIALQYGGSQLVHRIKTYRKIAPLSSHSRDIMQTLSRYMSNTFSDNEKQNAINVFLGVYVPFKARAAKLVPDVWDLQSDFYLHNPLEKITASRSESLTPLTCWWDEKVVSCLPMPASQVFKAEPENIVYSISKTNLRADGFFEQYKPYELKTLHETLSFQMLHTGKDFMPTNVADFSPFKVRGTASQPKRKESVQGYKWLDIFGQSSPSSDADSDDFVDDADQRSMRSNSLFPDQDSSMSSPVNDSVAFGSLILCTKQRTFESLLGRPEEWQEWDRPVSQRDQQRYRDYFAFGQANGQFHGGFGSGFKPLSSDPVLEDNYFDVSLFDFKETSKETERILQEYMRKSKFETNDLKPSKNDLRDLRNYLGLK